MRMGRRILQQLCDTLPCCSPRTKGYFTPNSQCMHQAQITSYMPFTQSSSQTLDSFALFAFDLVKNTSLDAAIAVDQRTSHTPSLPSDVETPVQPSHDGTRTNNGLTIIDVI